jgi:hypothetical protein
MIKQKVVSQGHSLEGVGEWCSCLGQQCQKGQQGNTNSLKTDFLYFTHFKLFSLMKEQSKNDCGFSKILLHLLVTAIVITLPQGRKKTSYASGNNYLIMLLFKHNDQF